MERRRSATLRYTIALARPRDLAGLPAIELAAARLLEGHAPERVLAESDVLFVATPHRVYRELPPQEGKTVIDVWNCLRQVDRPAPL